MGSSVIRREGGSEGTHAARAEFELHVDIVLVFEAAFKADHVRVLHRLVDLDFREELYERRGQASRGGGGRASRRTLDLVLVDFSCCLWTTFMALYDLPSSSTHR